MDPGQKSSPPDDAVASALPEGRKVLVVDDYEDAREMYAEYLEFLGYEVETASNGQEAVERARESHPDVILMDLSLPVLSGWDATQQLKTDASTRDIPVMALTGHVFASSSEKAREVGCDAFVTKPALPDTVADQIQALLRKTGSKPPSR
ncbi:response regulator [Archangium primigenium]|uniref:response regulator n=1 Tax=[Archangium] primigenium TaxID=2792470 RepID=UPI0019570AC0|nr:response regulator [Archangium primigenium]MBM7118087.1 response regulator [Archangium primigenium]